MKPSVNDWQAALQTVEALKLANQDNEQVWLPRLALLMRTWSKQNLAQRTPDQATAAMPLRVFLSHRFGSEDQRTRVSDAFKKACLKIGVQPLEGGGENSIGRQYLREQVRSSIDKCDMLICFSANFEQTSGTSQQADGLGWSGSQHHRHARSSDFGHWLSFEIGMAMGMGKTYYIATSDDLKAEALALFPDSELMSISKADYDSESKADNDRKTDLVIFFNKVLEASKTRWMNERIEWLRAQLGNSKLEN